MAKPERVQLGLITGVHGIRGDVIVKAFTADPEDIALYELTDASGGRPLRLKVRRITAKGLVAGVSGVTDRNGAEALKGTELWVERSLLPAPDEDEFYYVDLIGLEAVDLEGVRFGRIVQVANYGAGELLEIELDNTRNTELVPFKVEFVPHVDVTGGRVAVAWPLQFEVVNPSDGDDAENGDAGGSGAGNTN
ncbi:MAG: ribosome maturation factor RimM [Alphaproteobacteria bacterium]|nr:ribosome maturation factor RimM [Alphaproteobacteria bacterium]